MRLIDAAAIDAALDVPSLVTALARAFSGALSAPPRHHHAVERPGEAAATLLLMPAWTAPDRPGLPPAGRPYLGVKSVTVFPGNGARGLPAVAGAYLLVDGATGAPLAVMDGARLTLHRTAAASALAAGFLARPGAARLLVVGTGALAPFLARAHAAARPIREVIVWGRDGARAAAVAAALRADGLDAAPAGDLEAAVRRADVVSCATLSGEPLVRGAWLAPGAHLDLVGAFTPAMRECDDDAVRRARLFVDTRAGALAEGGDLVAPIRAGVIEAARIEAELSELCAGRAVNRRDEDVTLFKSVGASIEDLAAAALVWERAGGTAGGGAGGHAGAPA